jgi:hypothetical protein
LIQKSTIEKEASNSKPKHLANLQITYPIGLIQKSTKQVMLSLSILQNHAFPLVLRENKRHN